MPTTIDTGIALSPSGWVSLHDATGFAQTIVHLANGKTVRTAPAGTDEFRELKLDAQERRLMERWLNALPRPGTRVLKQIDNAFKQIRPTGFFMNSAVRDGRIQSSIDILLDAPTNEAQLAWLFANVLHFELGKNIRRCPECSIYFLDFPSRRPIKQFCCANHSNAHRQRKYRERKSS